MCVCVQSRTEEWVAISYSRTSSRPRDQTHSISWIFCIGRWILYRAIWEAPNFAGLMHKLDLHGGSWWGTHSYAGDLLYLFNLTLWLPCFEYLAQPQNPQTPQTCLPVFYASSPQSATPLQPASQGSPHPCTTCQGPVNSLPLKDKLRPIKQHQTSSG